MNSYMDAIASAFRADPRQERPGDRTPGEIAKLVVVALSKAGYHIVCSNCGSSVATIHYRGCPVGKQTP